jgi:hypothetical protein
MSLWDTIKDLCSNLPWPLTFGIGLLLGVITVTNKATRFESRVGTTEADVVALKKFIYKEHGGLNVLTEEEHESICQTNNEILDLKLAPLKTDIAVIKDILQKMQERRR